MGPRKNTARFYDIVSHPINVIPFYIERIKSLKAKMLRTWLRNRAWTFVFGEVM